MERITNPKKIYTDSDTGVNLYVVDLVKRKNDVTDMTQGYVVIDKVLSLEKNINWTEFINKTPVSYFFKGRSKNYYVIALNAVTDDFKDRDEQNKMFIEQFEPLFKLLRENGYVRKSKYQQRGGGYRGKRFQKKKYYTPQQEHKLIQSCDNGISVYIEKNTEGMIDLVVSINPEIERIEYSKFKEFKAEVMGRSFKYPFINTSGKREITSSLGVYYEPQKQLFKIYLYEFYDNYDENSERDKPLKEAIEQYANEICELSYKYYNVNDKFKSQGQPEETDRKKEIQEALDASEIAIQYLSGQEADDMREYIDSLKITLQYI